MHPLFHQYFQNYRSIVKDLNEVLKTHDLYNSQWTILFLLQENGAQTLTQIRRYLQVEAPTITRTVTRLEAMGLVKKVYGEDRREKTIQLTEKAIVKMPEIQASVEMFEANILARLTNEEISHLTTLLYKMKG